MLCCAVLSTAVLQYTDSAIQDQETLREEFSLIAERKLQLIQAQKDQLRRERNPKKPEDHGLIKTPMAASPSGQKQQAKRSPSLYGNVDSGPVEHPTPWDTSGDGEKEVEAARLNSNEFANRWCL